MSAWLKNYYQSDELPPRDIIVSGYCAAVRVLRNPQRFPNADKTTLYTLIEELEADAEACQMLPDPELIV